MVSVCGPGELLIIDVRALEVEDSNKETCDFKSRVIGAPPHLVPISKLNKSRDVALTQLNSFHPFWAAVSGITVKGRAKVVGNNIWCSVMGGEGVSQPEHELSSGLSKQGSEVRAMSRVGSFSSLLETSVHPSCLLLV